MSTDPRTEITERVLAEVEASRHLARGRGDVDFERSMSINDWIERIRGASQQAHQQARTEGATRLQYETWTDIAAIAVARAEVLAEILADEEADRQALTTDSDGGSI